MKIIPFYARGWESNSFLVISENQAALIDAGAAVQSVIDVLKRENAELKYIILTHGHFDHTISAEKLKELTGAKLVIHKEDDEMLTDAEKSALAFFLGRHDVIAPADITLEDGDTLSLGNSRLKLIHTPGHSKGSSCFLIDSSLFTGDTIFNGGYGRYDLHGGDGATLFASLASLKKLDGNLDIYPGHGDSTKLKKALNYLNLI